MIRHINFEIDPQDREFMHFSPDQFPYLCLYEPMELHVDATISWHWHQCYEVVYVAEGMTALAERLDMGRSSLYRSLDALTELGRIRRVRKKIYILRTEE